VAEVERTIEENNMLRLATASLNAETGKLKQERDAAVQRHHQVLEELGPLRLELTVTIADLQKARSNGNTQ
jgi:hypothetical protein